MAPECIVYSTNFVFCFECCSIFLFFWCVKILKLVSCQIGNFISRNHEKVDWCPSYADGSHFCSKTTLKLALWEIWLKSLGHASCPSFLWVSWLDTFAWLSAMYTCHNFCICPQNDLELLFVCSYSYLFAVERKDQKTLEKLRAERKAKIDELKERTNYYLTQQLIQASRQIAITQST